MLMTRTRRGPSSQPRLAQKPRLGSTFAATDREDTDVELTR